MEQSKIESFKKDHPGIDFPWFQTIAKTDHRFRDRLCHIAKLPKNSDGLKLVQQLESSGKIIITADLKDFCEDIPKALRNSGITPENHVFINWYRFDEVDEMRLDDFLHWFPELWYTGAEDPDVFDESLTWLLSLHHYYAFTIRSFNR